MWPFNCSQEFDFFICSRNSQLTENKARDQTSVEIVILNDILNDILNSLSTDESVYQRVNMILLSVGRSAAVD